MAQTPAQSPWRWLAPFLIIGLPFLLYWGGISQRFGLRDDYSNLHEAHERTGVLLGFCASQGRPVYGFLLERSYALLPSIDSFMWVRAAGTLLWGLTAALLVTILTRQLRWRTWPALALAALLVVLPGVQVETHWGVCWPHVLAGTLGVLAFACAEAGWQSAGRRRVLWLCGGLGLLWLAMLTYPSNALLYVIPVAAGFVAGAEAPWRERLLWVARHVAGVALMLTLAFLTIKVLFALQIFEESDRVELEAHWLDKAGWFFQEPLHNALALFVLDDDTLRTEPWHNLAAAAVAAGLLAGAVLEWRRRGARAALGWVAGLCALGLLAYAVSFVASERWPTYRTILALTGVLLVFLVRSLTNFAAANDWRRRGAGIVLLALVLAGGWMARHDSRHYLAEAQAAELRRIESAAARVEILRAPRVFMWLPEPQDSICAVSHLDEFGSLSGDCEWAAKEMLLQVIREKERRDETWDPPLEISTHYVAPLPKTYDVLVDLRTHG
jgi:hypothetical protein